MPSLITSSREAVAPPGLAYASWRQKKRKRLDPGRFGGGNSTTVTADQPRLGGLGAGVRPWLNSSPALTWQRQEGPVPAGGLGGLGGLLGWRGCSAGISSPPRPSPQELRRVRKEKDPGYSSFPGGRDSLWTDLLTTVVIPGRAGVPVLLVDLTLLPVKGCEARGGEGGSHRLDRPSKRLVVPALA